MVKLRHQLNGDSSASSSLAPIADQCESVEAAAAAVVVATEPRPSRQTSRGQLPAAGSPMLLPTAAGARGPPEQGPRQQSGGHQGRRRPTGSGQPAAGGPEGAPASGPKPELSAADQRPEPEADSSQKGPAADQQQQLQRQQHQVVLSSTPPAYAPQQVYEPAPSGQQAHYLGPCQLAYGQQQPLGYQPAYRPAQQQLSQPAPIQHQQQQQQPNSAVFLLRQQDLHQQHQQRLHQLHSHHHHSHQHHHQQQPQHQLQQQHQLQHHHHPQHQHQDHHQQHHQLQHHQPHEQQNYQPLRVPLGPFDETAAEDEAASLVSSLMLPAAPIRPEQGDGEGEEEKADELSSLLGGPTSSGSSRPHHQHHSPFGFEQLDKAAGEAFLAADQAGAGSEPVPSNDLEQASFASPIHRSPQEHSSYPTRQPKQHLPSGASNSQHLISASGSPATGSGQAAATLDSQGPTPSAGSSTSGSSHLSSNCQLRPTYLQHRAGYHSATVTMQPAGGGRGRPEVAASSAASSAGANSTITATANRYYVIQEASLRGQQPAAALSATPSEHQPLAGRVTMGTIDHSNLYMPTVFFYQSQQQGSGSTIDPKPGVISNGGGGGDGSSGSGSSNNNNRPNSVESSASAEAGCGPQSGEELIAEVVFNQPQQLQQQQQQQQQQHSADDENNNNNNDDDEQHHRQQEEDLTDSNSDFLSMLPSISYLDHSYAPQMLPSPISSGPSVTSGLMGGLAASAQRSA